MTKIKDLHKKWMKDPEYRREYEGLEEECEEGGKEGGCGEEKDHKLTETSLY